MAGFFERLKSGLSRTAEAVANLLARPMDAESAEQLRERLIAADFGPATADEVVEAARSVWKSEAALRKTSPAEAAAESIVRALGGDTADAPALSKPHVIMLLGVNDLRNRRGDPLEVPSVAGMIAGYRQIALRARTAGLKIFASTVLPDSEVTLSVQRGVSSP